MKTGMLLRLLAQAKSSSNRRRVMSTYKKVAEEDYCKCFNEDKEWIGYYTLYPNGVKECSLCGKKGGSRI